MLQRVPRVLYEDVCVLQHCKEIGHPCFVPGLGAFLCMCSHQLTAETQPWLVCWAKGFCKILALLHAHVTAQAPFPGVKYHPGNLPFLCLLVVGELSPLASAPALSLTASSCLFAFF